MYRTFFFTSNQILILYQKKLLQLRNSLKTPFKELLKALKHQLYWQKSCTFAIRLLYDLKEY